MGMTDKLRNMLGIDADDEDIEEVGMEQDELDVPQKSTRTKASNTGNVFKIESTAQLQVVLAKPERFEDASTIADHLNNTIGYCHNKA